MDGYAVKVDELGKLIGDLGTAADRMAGANKKLGGGGAFGALGTAELGKAGVEFEEAWRFGIGRLGEAASEVTERLKAAKQKYEEIEAQFGGELGKFGSAVLGDGVAGGESPGGVKGNHPQIAQPAEGPVGGGYTGGVPGIDDLAEGPAAGIGDLTSKAGPERPAGRTGSVTEPGEGPVGGGVTGGVPGIDRLAEPGGPAQPGDGPPGGGATGGITDLLNGLGR
ncbi:MULTISPECIES: hypothetical protein [unclassified Amycolatopsis]|uniref:hypothetical protein n=1 Tax=unclassified Amycolatopsis TaxID=2618356 RepID=UPI00287521E8|nr:MULTISPECIES: hypothetical protein [unclassified Amycolatopsis]MDS0133866.1 hypothetical protein [Amycolatopsis sp. 505]MDS0144742.1 hypothetical protein [Amycolatopsis sp. CM201R]